MKFHCLFILLMALLFCSCGSRQITILSYNVQNLFDETYQGTEYKDFGPSRWGKQEAAAKRAAIARAIRRSCSGGPDIVALQEVENRNALEGLNREPGMGYPHLFLVPKEGSPVNTAFLSRIKIDRVKIHDPFYPGLRTIPEAHFILKDKRIIIFNNHWKSRSGGARETEPLRLLSSGIIARRIGELLKENPGEDIIVLGDFNAMERDWQTYDGKIQTVFIPRGVTPPERFKNTSFFLTDTAPGDAKNRISFYDPWYEVPEKKRGSYFYQGHWQDLDHIFLAPGLFDRKDFTYTPGDFKKVTLSFLLKPGSGTPVKWEKGKGFSDHLPLLIQLSY